MFLLIIFKILSRAVVANLWRACCSGHAGLCWHMSQVAQLPGSHASGNTALRGSVGTAINQVGFVLWFGHLVLKRFTVTGLGPNK